ncbi:MAG: hypothetical protein AAFQ96_02085, partial [Pseudomonadota bacterium]
PKRRLVAIVLARCALRKSKLTFFERLQSTNAYVAVWRPACQSLIRLTNIRPVTMETIIAKSKSIDAGDPVREAIANLEERMDAIATTLMGTEEFARTANIASNVQMRMQKGMNTHMARQLAMFNMPSRDDITALGERLMSVDERLVRIEDMLRKIAPPEAAAARAGQPPRTKKPKKKAAKKSAARKASSSKGA